MRLSNGNFKWIVGKASEQCLKYPFVGQPCVQLAGMQTESSLLYLPLGVIDFVLPLTIDRS